MWKTSDRLGWKYKTTKERLAEGAKKEQNS